MRRAVPGGSGSTGCRCGARAGAHGRRRTSRARPGDCRPRLRLLLPLVECAPRRGARRCCRSVRSRPGRRPRHPADAGIDGLRLFSIRSPRPWLAGDVGRALVASASNVGSVRACASCPTRSRRSSSSLRRSPTPSSPSTMSRSPLTMSSSLCWPAGELCPTVTATSPVSVDTAMRWFGTDRLSWGSDHPQHGAEYPTPVDLSAARRLWFGGSVDR